MTTYLSGGWYAGAKGGLRTEVLDGAMDAAGLLHRAGVSPALVSRLALRVRSLVRVGDGAAPDFTGDDRRILGERLDPIVGDLPELVSFVADCLDHVGRPADLMAFYLHLMHITRMMQLLALATRGPTLEPGGTGRATPTPEPATRRGAGKARRTTAAARKKTPTRGTSGSKTAAKRRSPKAPVKPRNKSRTVRKAGAKRPR
jgi:hypothetical protein